MFGVSSWNVYLGFCVSNTSWITLAIGIFQTFFEQRPCYVVLFVQYLFWGSRVHTGRVTKSLIKILRYPGEWNLVVGHSRFPKNQPWRHSRKCIDGTRSACIRRKINSTVVFRRKRREFSRSQKACLTVPSLRAKSKKKKKNNRKKK